jgi:hypothetical protein
MCAQTKLICQLSSTNRCMGRLVFGAEESLAQVISIIMFKYAMILFYFNHCSMIFILACPLPSQRKEIRLVQCNRKSQPHNCTLWCCSQFLTVILFVWVVPTPYSTLLSSLRCGSKELCQYFTPNKKTFHSNHHHRSIYASIKTA